MVLGSDPRLLARLSSLSLRAHRLPLFATTQEASVKGHVVRISGIPHCVYSKAVFAALLAAIPPLETTAAKAPAGLNPRGPWSSKLSILGNLWPPQCETAVPLVQETAPSRSRTLI